MSRFKWFAALVLAALVVGACSKAATPDASDNAPDDSTQDDSTPDDSTPDDSEPVAEEPVVEEPVVEEPVVEEPVVEEPELVMLSLTPDPVGSTDELETVNHLEGVYLWPVEGGTAILFSQLDVGVGVTVEDEMSGFRATCAMWMGGGDGSLVAQCSATNSATGEYLSGPELEILDNPLGYGFVAPFTADQDYVSLAFGEVIYMAQRARFGDEPALVRIDPSTGNLSDPVTRTVGYATAAEVAARLA